MDLIFGVLTLSFGVYALIKGRLQLSKKYVLEGNSAKFAGFLLVIAPVIGGILTLNGQVDSAIFGCSCYSIIGVLAFAAFQMWTSKRSPQVKTQIKSEPPLSKKREPIQSHVTQTQPAVSNDSNKQRMPDANVNARTEQKELPPKDRIEPKSTPICPICGNIGLPKDKFCRKCGSPIKSEIHCKKCGNIVQPKDLFCVKCGSHLGSKNVEAKPTESAEVTSGKQLDVTGEGDGMKHSLPEVYSRKSDVAVGTQYDLVMVVCDIDPLDKNAYLLSILNILQISLSKNAQGMVKQHPDARILDKVFPYSMAYALTHFSRISLELDDSSIRYMQFEYPQNSITIGGYVFWMCGKKL